MPMPTIVVVRAFMLQLEPRKIGETPDPANADRKLPLMSLPEKIFFTPGVHEVTDEVADHWYTKLHLEGYREPPKGPGTAEYQVTQAVAEQPPPAQEPDPADPTQPAPEASTAPRPAQPPPSAERSVPRRVAR
jgi:hypothetical protein